MNSVNSEIKRYRRNIGQNWYHIVLVTKYRSKIFQWKETKQLAEKSFDFVCEKHNITIFTKEVMCDHVHLFVTCPPKYSINKLFQILKGGSSYYIRKNYTSLKKYKHLWNRGTMYRTVGNVSADTIKKYIDESNNWSKNK